MVFAYWCVRSDCVGISYRHVRVSPPVTNYDRCVQFDLLWGAVVAGGVIGGELISYGKHGVYGATRNIRSVHVSGL